MFPLKIKIFKTLYNVLEGNVWWVYVQNFKLWVYVQNVKFIS